MKKFFYKVVDNQNNYINYFLIAKDKNEAIFQLKSKGYFVINIKPKSILTQDIRISKTLSKKDLSFFARQLNFFISSGVSVYSIDKLSHNKIISHEFDILKNNLLKGNSISESLILQKFPSMFCNMVKIGEMTGILDKLLNQVENYYSKEANTEKELISLAIYPAIVLFAMIIIVFITIVYLIPNFTTMFLMQNIEIPYLTMYLINISDLFTSGLILLPIFLFLIIFLFLKKMNIIDYILWRLPIISKILQATVTARFSATMIVMLNSGVPILDTLNTSIGLSKNNKYKKNIHEIITSIKKGKSLSESMEKTTVFHPLLLDLIKLGESTGMLTSSFEKATEYFEKEQEYMFADLKKKIEPSLTIIMGIILLFIMLAIMLPLFSIVEVI
ncbi:MAG: type II secretion system F family protein [Defluviitaleaceae bacterium]|nr:type II secretion system F family protein [Defluviitaleaceae bacterium]